MNANQTDSFVCTGAGGCDEPERAPSVVHFSLILRIWRDAAGHVWGHMVEPLADRRTPFDEEATLWRLLAERIRHAQEAAPDDQTTGDEA